MIQVIEQVEGLCHIRHIHPQPYRPCPLLEGAAFRAGTHARAGELVERFAEADMPFMPQPLDCGDHILVKTHSRPHFMSLTSGMPAIKHQDEPRLYIK
ncbi:hypothetical protein OHA77_27500 [Streptosporangium sp. NBC_01639]|nr:hypothetical protein OHA77_27500 [Streptosporangium sp. NBC_01639]